METPESDSVSPLPVPIQKEEEIPQNQAEKLIFQGKFSKALSIYKSLQSSLTPNNTLEYAKLLDRISFIHYELCQYTEALDTCHQSFSIKSSRQYGDEIYFIENYQIFGMIYRDQAKYPDSLTSYTKAEEISLKYYPKDHPKLTKIYYEFGLLYLKLAKFDTAIQYHKNTIDILSTQPSNPSDNVQIGKSYEALGTIHRYKGLLQEAKTYYDKAQEYKLKDLDPEHLEIANVNNNLGILAMDQGEYDKARELCEKSLKTRLNHFTNHIDIAKSYFSLARVSIKTAKFEDGLVYEKKAYDMLREFFGEEHPDVATTYNNTGSILYKQQKSDQALECFLKAQNIYSKIFEEDHPSMAETLNNIGMAYKAQKKYTQALNYYQQSLAIRIKNFGEDHISLAFIYNNIGILLDSQMNYDEALKYYKKSLDIKILKVGNDHPDVATTYYNMASLLDDKEDFAMAMEYYKKSLTIRLKKLDKFHLSVANTYYNMAILSKRLQDYASAIMYYRASLQAYLSIWGPYHPDVVEASFRLGLALKTVNQYEQAVSSLKIAYLTQKKCETKEDAYFTRQIMNELEDTSILQQKFQRNF